MEDDAHRTCAYCGHAYPEGVPSYRHPALDDHIRTCDSHPMAEAVRRIAALRGVLGELLGASTPADLDLLEMGMVMFPDDPATPIARRAIAIMRDTSDNPFVAGVPDEGR